MKNNNLKIEYRKIDELVPYINNARKNEGAIDKVASSIKNFGMVNPILIDKDNEIIAGHTRLLALKKLGYVETPTIRLDDLTEPEVKALRLADNKTSEFSEWDYELLSVELDYLQSIEDLDFSMFEFGFDDIAISEENDVVEDETEIELPKEPKSKFGNIYKLGRHRLMCGDSTKKEYIDKLMDGKKANIIYTDPPYGMFLNTDFTSMGNGKKYEKIKGDAEDFSEDLISTVFNNFGYCKEIFLWGADYFAELIPNRKDGSWLVWDKQNNGEGFNDAYDKMFGSNFELCWSKNRHKRALARVLWKGFSGMENEDTKKRVHPTQKPIKLAEWFLEKFSKEGDVVVDLYGGSGSTLICCEQMNRTCFMMEYEPSYIDVIINRWEEFTGQKAELL